MKAKHTLYYYISADSLDTKDPRSKDLILEQSCRGSSCWFKGLPLYFAKGINSLRDYMTQYLEWSYGREGSTSPLLEIPKTARICPSIHAALDESILVKFPVDLAITINKNSEWAWKSPEDEGDLLKITQHPTEQVSVSTCTINPFNNKLVLKFCLGAVIDNRSKFPFVFLQPQFHKDMPYEIICSPVPSTYGECMNLNVIFSINIPRRDTVTHLFNKGEVLAYLWVPGGVKLKQLKTEIKPRKNMRFIRGTSR